VNLFADDTCLFCTANTYQDLEIKCNEALKECNEWLIYNRLTLNIDKTYFIDFSNKRNQEETVLTLKIDSKPINQVNQIKYLGLTFQSNLKWDSHINNIIKKLNKQIPLYYQLRDFIPATKKITIYKALSLPNILYGIEIYGRKETLWIKQLQKTKNRLLKILLK